MKKIFIIEDNQKDFTNLTKLITERFVDIEIYPSTIEENNLLRKNIKALFSAKTTAREPARNYLNDLKINAYDGLILDYELYPSIRLVTGINLYLELNLNIKALVLTKYTGSDYDAIIELVERDEGKKFTNKILVKQKGNLVFPSEDQKIEHSKNISNHIFGKSQDSQLRKKIIEKLKKNKPKIIAATTDVLRETAKLTDEVIKKIDDLQIEIYESLFEELNENNEQLYLNLLKKLNS